MTLLDLILLWFVVAVVVALGVGAAVGRADLREGVDDAEEWL